MEEQKKGEHAKGNQQLTESNSGNKHLQAWKTEEEKMRQSQTTQNTTKQTQK